MTKEDLNFVREAYINFDVDIKDALQYYNPNNTFTPQALKDALGPFLDKCKINKEHKSLTDSINKTIGENRVQNINDWVLKAASIRRFLG